MSLTILRLAIAALSIVFSAVSSAEERTADVPYFQTSDIKFQTTYVWQQKPGFSALYDGPNSLTSQREPRSYTLTATAFMGIRPWQGGELYYNPEMSASQSLSSLHGLGGLSNGENQKGGGPHPKFYNARLFLRQTWGLGGGTEKVESAPNALAGSVDKNRVVLTIGKISLMDIFDGNAYSHDPRTQFLNWAIMANGAFDYAADSKGYTSGAALEYYRDDWVLRFARFTQPKESNGLPLDYRIFDHYGDQLEVEHGHEIAGEAGKLRAFVFRNRAKMGGFADAVADWRVAGQVDVPSVADVRREQKKRGYGFNLEQSLSANVGLFMRGSWADGKTETYAFTEIERSLSGGLSIKGGGWGRSEDTLGLAMVQNGLSTAHRDYLSKGGLGAFIGDGVPPAGANFRYVPERIFESYYSFAVTKDVDAALDYQRIWNPAYNADRGTVNIYSFRLHAEF